MRHDVLRRYAVRPRDVQDAAELADPVRSSKATTRAGSISPLSGSSSSAGSAASRRGRKRSRKGAPNSAGRPIHDLSRPGQALSFLGYAEPCHLGWALQPQLQAWPSLDLRQAHAASLTDGLRFMALSGLGLAWLPESLVRHDVSTRRLVRAGNERFDVPLRLTLFRQNAPMGRQAEDLWVHLSAMAERVDGAIEFTEGLPAA